MSGERHRVEERIVPIGVSRGIDHTIEIQTLLRQPMSVLYPEQNRMMPESPDVPWFVPCLKTSRSKQENLENCIHWSTGKLHSLTLTFQDGCKEKRWSKV